MRRPDGSRQQAMPPLTARSMVRWRRPTRAVNGRPINFRVVLPASWTKSCRATWRRWNERVDSRSDGRRSRGTVAARIRYVRQRLRTPAGRVRTAARRRSGRTPCPWRGPRSGESVAATVAPTSDRRAAAELRQQRLQGDWSLSDEAIKNLGYMQMKKTHDAAVVLMERIYGGAAALQLLRRQLAGRARSLDRSSTLSGRLQRHCSECPDSQFLLADAGSRVDPHSGEACWPTGSRRQKPKAIRAEFVRQCDKLDGLADGVINNYMACRAIFDMSQGSATRNPWVARRCPNNVDPNPQDTTAAACFTDGQISTLKVVYSRYKERNSRWRTEKHGRSVCGSPTADPSGSGLIANARYRGQEGAAENAQNPFAPREAPCHRIFDEESPPPIRSTTLRAVRSTRGVRRSQLWLDSDESRSFRIRKNGAER